jgi:hypothetical protein
MWGWSRELRQAWGTSLDAYLGEVVRSVTRAASSATASPVYVGVAEEVGGLLGGAPDGFDVSAVLVKVER